LIDRAVIRAAAQPDDRAQLARHCRALLPSLSSVKSGPLGRCVFGLVLAWPSLTIGRADFADD
jgi:hypothetical protein